MTIKRRPGDLASLASALVPPPPTLPRGLAAAAVPLVQVERGGVVESLHLGHLVVTGADGSVLAAAGDPEVGVYARSALKPLQAVGLLRAGLARGGDGDARSLAMACASHNGEPVHLEAVRDALAAAGLSEADLANTPDLPLHPPSAARWQAEGRGPSSLAQNCSGKHAAMLATCGAGGWPVAGYLEADHPVQVAVLGAVADQVGGLLQGPQGPRGGGDAASRRATTDGCGTPLPLVSLVSLARAYGVLASAEPGGDGLGDAPARVAAAMRAHPHLVGGEGRVATTAMTSVAGLVAKDGAEGVFAFGLPDGRGVALKVLDGSTRPFPVVVAGLLAALGADSPGMREAGRVPVLGRGEPVGAVTVVDGLLEELAGALASSASSTPAAPTISS